MNIVLLFHLKSFYLILRLGILLKILNDLHMDYLMISVRKRRERRIFLYTLDTKIKFILGRETGYNKSTVVDISKSEYNQI